MEVLVEGINLHPSEVVLRESLFDYTATMQFSLPYPAVFEECTLRIVDDLPYIPVSVKQASADTFQYLCYPKGYIDFLQGVSSPINLTGELPDLLDAFSMFTYGIISVTQSQHWVLPSMSGKSILDKLSRQVRFVNGGCPTAHFDPTGTLICQDVLQRCTDDVTGIISGTLTEGVSSMASMNLLQGTMKYHYFDDDTYSTKEDVYMEDAGMANMYKFVVAEDRKVQVEQELQSMFWRRYISTSVVTYTDLLTSVLSPGQKIQFMGSEQTYICISVQTQTNTQGATITGTFLPSITPQQTLG